MALKKIHISAMALVLSVSALSGCISFGSEPPPALLTLTADTSVAAGTSRTGTVGTAVIVDVPDAEQKLGTTRLPVQIDDSSVAYLKDAVWVDRPNRLFRRLVSDTIAARSGRLVLDEVEISGQSAVRLSGNLVDFGYDARTQEVIVTFDAVRRIPGSDDIEKRRFQSRESVAVEEAGPVGAAMNIAANKVAIEIADWIG